MRTFRRFIRRPIRRWLVTKRKFYRDGKLESRVFCPCELCALRHGRMLIPRSGLGHSIRFRRIAGFSGNFKPGKN